MQDGLVYTKDTHVGKAAFAETWSILHFPSTLEEVGEASLFGVSEIYLTEGTAPDLGEALTFWKKKKDDDRQSDVQVPLWQTCRLHIYSRKGAPPIDLLLPRSLIRKGRQLFNRLWDQQDFSATRLSGLVSEIETGSEREKCALPLLLAHPGAKEAAPLLKVVCKFSDRMGMDYLQRRDLDSFRLLSLDVVSPDNLDLFLKEANRLQFPEAVGYILEAKRGRQEAGFSKFQL